ncbi:MAG: hypothetical protein AAB373_03545 [Patescibacteria group bacterium]
MENVVSISDIHPARILEGFDHAESALNGFVDFAGQNSARLVLNGDQTEHYLAAKPGVIDPAVYDRESRMLGRGVARYSNSTGFAPMVMRGNHDPVDLDQAFMQKLYDPDGQLGLRFDVQKDALVHAGPDVLIHHGHLLQGIKSVRDAIEKTLRGEIDQDDLMAVMNGTQAEAEFWRKEKKHDRMIHLAMTLARLIGKDRKLEAEIAPRSILRSKAKEQGDHVRWGFETWSIAEHFTNMKFDEAVVGDELRFAEEMTKARVPKKLSMTDGAAYLTAAMGAKVITVGHDHAAGLVRRRILLANAGVKDVLVANSGHWVGDKSPKTAVFVNGGEQEVSILTADVEGKVSTMIGPVSFA